ncbi:MAG: hypothetical protein Q9204_000665 [Flavoplaca sp. TL-2023a]
MVTIGLSVMMGVRVAVTTDARIATTMIVVATVVAHGRQLGATDRVLARDAIGHQVAVAQVGTALGLMGDIQDATALGHPSGPDHGLMGDIHDATALGHTSGPDHHAGRTAAGLRVDQGLELQLRLRLNGCQWLKPFFFPRSWVVELHLAPAPNGWPTSWQLPSAPGTEPPVPTSAYAPPPPPAPAPAPAPARPSAPQVEEKKKTANQLKKEAFCQRQKEKKKEKKAKLRMERKKEEEKKKEKKEEKKEEEEDDALVLGEGGALVRRESSVPRVEDRNVADIADFLRGMGLRPNAAEDIQPQPQPQPQRPLPFPQTSLPVLPTAVYQQFNYGLGAQDAPAAPTVPGWPMVIPGQTNLGPAWGTANPGQTNPGLSSFPGPGDVALRRGPSFGFPSSSRITEAMDEDDEDKKDEK